MVISALSQEKTLIITCGKGLRSKSDKNSNPHSLNPFESESSIAPASSEKGSKSKVRWHKYPLFQYLMVPQVPVGHVPLVFLSLSCSAGFQNEKS